MLVIGTYLEFGNWNLTYYNMISLAERYLRKFRLKIRGWDRGMETVRLTAKVKKAG